MESTVLVFLVGLCVGIVLALLLHQAEIKSDLYNKIDNRFEDHLQVLPAVEFEEMKSKYVYKKLNLLCVVFVQKSENLIAVNDTWASSCKNRLFYSNVADFKEGDGSHIFVKHSNSSWHLFCNVIEIIAKQYVDVEWMLFVNDNTFVIPENIEYIIANLNPNELYYMGHPISTSGVDYNVESAGFVMSREAVKQIAEKFRTMNICLKDGYHWKKEDYYLGKYLNEIGIKPVDTRDENGMVTFMGYDLISMMNPGSNPVFAKYYTNSLIPVKCCSYRAITFQVSRPSLMYTIYYAIYKLKIFTGGAFNKHHASAIAVRDDFVWHQFLRDIGKPLNVTSEEYRKLWQIQIDKDAKNATLSSSSNYNPFRFLIANVEKKNTTL